MKLVFSGVKAAQLANLCVFINQVAETDISQTTEEQSESILNSQAKNWWVYSKRDLETRRPIVRLKKARSYGMERGTLFRIKIQILENYALYSEDEEFDGYYGPPTLKLIGAIMDCLGY